ncbi:MAG TPA: M64 family metallopeptidase, partial [Myxococcaceae bacterium]|nr:M64 family metallopeptidase [Myxococcaceae bacterium]
MRLAALLLLASATAIAAPPRTLRIDYFHTGTEGKEIFSLDRLIVEPLPWPGNPARPIDDTDSGKYRFLVRDASSKALLYSRGFSSIFGEWEDTQEARERARTFEESLRFPLPRGPVEVTLEKRDQANAFVPVWTFRVDPKDQTVSDAAPDSPGPLIPLLKSGPSESKVDVLILGDGYTRTQRAKFEKDARRLVSILFSQSPFKERKQDFNVWGLCPESREAGISRPSTGVHRRSRIGATYDAFGSERYVLTFDNRSFRDVASFAPYEFVEILVNGNTYGGGGIFGLYSTVAADSFWSPYVFVHEFGHHFAALADEYFIADTAQ